jgi:hypothetical protein
MKVMPEPTDFPWDHFNGPLSIRSYWYASARGKAAGRQMLSGFWGRAEAKGPTAASLLTEPYSRSLTIILSSGRRLV